MGKYWKVLGEYDAEGTTYAAFAGGAGSSPYTPDEDARLIGIRTLVGDDAATSLVNHGQIKLTCSTFKPNSIEVAFQGTGLRTVPAFMQMPIDHVVDQPVKAGVPITLEGRHLTADTPVTASVIVMGCFVS
jgi:hypothetical protein